jgi:hypothetical protein
MNPSKTLRSAAAIAALCALAACGGGAGEDDEHIAPASPQTVQSFNLLADHCGAGVMLPTTDRTRTLQQLDARWVTRDGVAYPVTTAYALNGFSGLADSAWPMPVPLFDLRGLTTGPYVSRGIAYPDVQMGVFVAPVLPAGGISCVMAVAGMRNNRDGTGTAVWTARDGALELAGLPAPAVNGFEWLANYPVTGSAAFTVRKESMDPSTARICRRAPAASTWACSVPVLSASATSFTFTSGPATPGIHVLVGDKPVPAQ